MSRWGKRDTVAEKRAKAAAFSRKWRREHPELLKKESAARYLRTKAKVDKQNWRGHLRRKYGLTEAAYLAMTKAQGGKCAICGKRNKSKHRLAVDHDHVTGNVRALLCRMCNGMLGYSRDQPATLRLGAEYLERHAKGQSK
jgi:hypothetical protein